MYNEYMDYDYMDKLASVQAYGVEPEEAYAAMEDAEAAYAEGLDKLAAIEAEYAEELEKMAFAEDLYAEAAEYIDYLDKVASCCGGGAGGATPAYAPLPESVVGEEALGRVPAKVPAVRQGEPGSAAASPLEQYAAAAR